MNFITEEFYTIVESALMIGFIAVYFEPKPKFSTKLTTLIAFLAFLIFDTLMSLTSPPWIVVFLFSAIVLVVLEELLFQGTLWEHLLVSIIELLEVILIDAGVFTMLSYILQVEYRELVHQSTAFRFLAVIIAKILFVIASVVVISIKKRYFLLLHRNECIMVSITIFISALLIIFIRNMAFHSEQYYTTFLIMLACILLLNVVQYFIIIQIGKKNSSEQNLAIIKKQLEMQKESLKLLEEKYDETSKMRHDLKHYTSCAMRMLKDRDIEGLENFFEKISVDKVDEMNSYIKINRSVIGAVLNTKMEQAKRLNIHIEYIVLSEMDNMDDFDAGIMLANLLDNAIEACERNQGESDILLKIWNEAGYYCIELSNTVETDVLRDNPDLQTSKADKFMHGLGLQSVKKIIDKYNGIVNFTQKSNRFFVYVSIMKCIS